MNSIEKFYENVFLYFHLYGLLSGLSVNTPIINIVEEKLIYVCLKVNFRYYNYLTQ